MRKGRSEGSGCFSIYDHERQRALEADDWYDDELVRELPLLRSIGWIASVESSYARLLDQRHLSPRLIGDLHVESTLNAVEDRKGNHMATWFVPKLRTRRCAATTIAITVLFLALVDSAVHSVYMVPQLSLVVRFQS